MIGNNISHHILGNNISQHNVVITSTIIQSVTVAITPATMATTSAMFNSIVISDIVSLKRRFAI